MLTKSIIVYDSQCNFCISQINTIKKLVLNKDIFDYQPRNNADLELAIPKIKTFDFSKGILFINKDQEIYIGSDAIYHISNNLKVLHYFSFLYQIPFLKPIFKFLYFLIAKNRYFLSRFCNSDNCSL